MNILLKPFVRWSILILTVIALVYLNVASRNTPVQSSMAEPTKARGLASVPTVTETLPSWRGVWEHEIQDIFQTQPPPAPPPVIRPVARVLKPVPAPVIAAESTVPSTPVFPYTILGHFVQNQQRTLYLSGPGGVLAVRQGDLLPGGEYRVDALESRQAKITYLPMNHAHVLPLDVLE